jgi:hypothetical protein
MAELACGFPAVTLPHIAGAMENPALSVDVRVKYAEVVSNVIEQCPPNILGSYVPDIASRLLRMLEMNAAYVMCRIPMPQV